MSSVLVPDGSPVAAGKSIAALPARSRPSYSPASVLTPAFLTLLFLTSGPVDSDHWIVLFDGRSTDAWRGYSRDSFPDDCWVVEGDTLRDGGGSQDPARPRHPREVRATSSSSSSGSSPRAETAASSTGSRSLPASPPGTPARRCRSSTTTSTRELPQEPGRRPLRPDRCPSDKTLSRRQMEQGAAPRERQPRGALAQRKEGPRVRAWQPRPRWTHRRQQVQGHAALRPRAGGPRRAAAPR